MKFSLIYFSLFLFLSLCRSSLSSKLKKRQFLPRPIAPNVHLLKSNPLALHLALKLHPKNIVILSKNVKEFIFNIYKGYLINLLKMKIDPNKIFDIKSKREIVVKHALKEITCTNPHVLLINSSPIFSRLYQEIYFMDNHNYIKLPKLLVDQLLKLILSAGYSCNHMIDYHNYFNNQIKRDFKYLDKIDHKVKSQLFTKLAIEKSHFLSSWNNFEKMGLYLGRIFSVFRMFKPKDKEKAKVEQIVSLYNALNNEKKRKKMQNILEKKLKRLMGEI